MKLVSTKFKLELLTSPRPFFSSDSEFVHSKLSFNFASNDSGLFSKLKAPFQGTRSESREEIKQNVMAHLSSLYEILPGEYMRHFEYTSYK
ncbi:hypothetical protein TNIN_493331 [Trichonephila inaurata madagascariensis]|uniref:Uncharacterized protein n=1 Tax=Trichonephila inaurata madagascariensis TaxID=2747483 RepID=A0A8X6JQH2_9ARAC|nr:hypothetical protein TNIN_493331 [Trichonephila inaurata madagascariensis]